MLFEQKNTFIYKLLTHTKQVTEMKVTHSHSTIHNRKQLTEPSVTSYLCFIWHFVCYFTARFIVQWLVYVFILTKGCHLSHETFGWLINDPSMIYECNGFTIVLLFIFVCMLLSRSTMTYSTEMNVTTVCNMKQKIKKVASFKCLVVRLYNIFLLFLVLSSWWK